MKAARILLVDDEAEIVRLLTRRLTRLGHQVTGASGSVQALGLSHVGAFDLAILDFMLPAINGLELAKQLRRRDPDLKILMLTGSFVTAEIEVEGYPYLTKPLEDLRELDRLVERLLVSGGHHLKKEGAGDERASHLGGG